MNLYQERFEIRFTKNSKELRETQKLRHKVFIEETGVSEIQYDNPNKLELDKFDDFCRHLIIVDHYKKNNLFKNKIIGVTRMMLDEDSKNGIGFYCSQEFNLNRLISNKKKCLEIGRTCIDPDYRNTLILHYLWKEIGSFCIKNCIELLFGVASFRGNNVEKISMALSLLHNNYLAPYKTRPNALKQGYVNMDIIPKEEINKLVALKQMPNLLKSYLKLGAVVGEGAFMDKELNTIDVLIMIDVLSMSKKYKEYYGKI